jgi:hypothetical protein
MLLNGASDIEILGKNIRATDLRKIQLWHDSISQNKHYLTVAYEIAIDLKHAKKMYDMYEEHQEGKTVSHCPKRSQVTLAFKLLLNGYNDDEILEAGCTDSDIYSAKRFIEIAPEAEKHLLHTMAQQFGIARETVARMLKIYRQRMQVEDIQDNRIPILA